MFNKTQCLQRRFFFLTYKNKILVMEDLYISGTPGMWPVQPVVPPTHYYDIIPLQMDTEGHSSLLVNNQVLSWFGNWKHFFSISNKFLCSSWRFNLKSIWLAFLRPRRFNNTVGYSLKWCQRIRVKTTPCKVKLMVV